MNAVQVGLDGLRARPIISNVGPAISHKIKLEPQAEVITISDDEPPAPPRINIKKEVKMEPLDHRTESLSEKRCSKCYQIGHSSRKCSILAQARPEETPQEFKEELRRLKEELELMKRKLSAAGPSQSRDEARAKQASHDRRAQLLRDFKKTKKMLERKKRKRKMYNPSPSPCLGK